jgi:uncharacterized protein
MAEPGKEIGSINWQDLTVPNAEEIKDFYIKVVGWEPSPVDMGGYNDFNMNIPSDGKTAAGICHARGSNAGLPPQWLIYITVADVDESSKKCIELGGKILVEPKDMGSYGRFCVIQDPAGAAAALFQYPK